MHKTLAVFALSLFVAVPANASFWVAIGSFQDAAVAARVVKEASTALNETFSVQQAETSSGAVQRVATGPFESRAEAEAAQEKAKARGYPDSWIFSRTSDEMTVGAAADTNHNVDTMEGDSSDQPALDVSHQRTLQEALKQVHELPTEIPPGYQLNQLYRDGRIPTPPTPK